MVSSSHGWFNLINAVIPVSQMAFTAERSAPLASAWHSSCNSIDTSSLVLSFLCWGFDKVPDDNISASVVSVFRLNILVLQGSAFSAECFTPANLTHVK